jgi:hypothetical protein
MDLTAFYATVSGVGFTLLGLWWIVVDKHPEWFERRDTALMAYVISLQFIIPATASLLSLVAAELPGLWRTVFAVLGLVGIAGAVLVARVVRGTPGVSAAALLSALPVYVAMVIVAVLPPLDLGLTPLQLEALLVALMLVLGLHAVWFFSHYYGRVGDPPRERSTS